MFALIIFVVFFVIALAGVPLMYALLVTTVGMIWANDLGHPLETIFLSFISGVEPFILIAVPLFIFGVGFGFEQWVDSYLTQVPRSPGTIMLVALPIIVSFEMLLQAINIDINSVPKRN